MDLRELLAEWLHEKPRSLSEYRLFGGLVEAVEPGDTPTDQEYNDARDARIRFLQEQLAEAKAVIESLRQHVTFYDADAEVGRLVRGMQNDSSLRHVASRYHAFTYVAPARAWGHVTSVDSPAEALHGIQASEEEE